jgi:hypothetical protein
MGGKVGMADGTCVNGDDVGIATGGLVTTGAGTGADTGVETGVDTGVETGAETGFGIGLGFPSRTITAVPPQLFKLKQP